MPYNLTVICGAGGTGKSFLSERLNSDFTIDTDGWAHYPWEDQSKLVAGAIGLQVERSDTTVCGFTALRGVRKFLQSEDDFKGKITVFFMKSVRSVSRYREADAKAQETILRDLAILCDKSGIDLVVYNLTEGLNVH